MIIFAPFIKSLSSSHKNKHVFNISLGFPTLPDGCCLWSISLSSSYLSTCIHPGLIAFTVIGVFDKDITKLLVKETIPPFEAP